MDIFEEGQSSGQAGLFEYMRSILLLLLLALLALAAYGQQAPARPASGPRISTIAWRGNRVLSTGQLERAFGLQPGDPYDSASVAAHLAYQPNSTDIASRYLDHGYFAFTITPVTQHHPDGTTDLTLVVVEGRPAQLGTIAIVGGPEVPATELLAQLPLRSGDLFSRARLVEAQQLLAEAGSFAPSRIVVANHRRLRRSAATDLVDITFTIKEP